MKKIYSAVFAVICLNCYQSASAATVEETLSIGTTISPVCSVTVDYKTDLSAHVVYDAVAVQQTESQFIHQYSDVIVKCSLGTPNVSVAMGLGLNDVLNVCEHPRRRMSDGNGHFLEYGLRVKNAQWSNWSCDPTHVQYPIFTSQMTQVIPAVLVIFGAQNVPKGNYSDTVDVIVTF